VCRDSSKQRLTTYDDDRLVRKYLKADVIPFILPNALHYLSSRHGTPRSTVTAMHSASRREQQANEFDNLAEMFMADRGPRISTAAVRAIDNRLKAESTIPAGFTLRLSSRTSEYNPTRFLI